MRHAAIALCLLALNACAGWLAWHIYQGLRLP